MHYKGRLLVHLAAGTASELTATGFWAVLSSFCDRSAMNTIRRDMLT